MLQPSTIDGREPSSRVDGVTLLIVSLLVVLRIVSMCREGCTFPDKTLLNIRDKA